MCLYSLQESPLIAENDITVYKVVQFITDENRSLQIGKPFCYYIGAFQDEYVYTMDSVIDSELSRENPFYQDGFASVIHKGFHSLAIHDEAVYLMDHMKAMKWFSPNAKPRILKCTIPKGSEYYVGDFDNKVSYASNKIILHSV